MNFSDFKNSGNVLSKEEMSGVKGGGTCGYKGADGTIICGISKAGALFMLTDKGDRWCCDSCGTSSYCG